jgi:hypothetical protein
VNQKPRDVVSENSIFIWIALAPAAILLVPWIAMQFTTEIDWDGADFIVMGSLVFGMASLFVVVARKARRSHFLLIGSIFVAVFLYVWAELAVGVFTSFGS